MQGAREILLKTTVPYLKYEQKCATPLELLGTMICMFNNDCTV